MKSLILFEAFLIAALVIITMIADLTMSRVGQLLIGIGVINLVVGIFASLRLPMLRGDVSDLSPLNRRDSHEVGQDSVNRAPGRPSRGYVVALIVIAFVAFGAGIVLLMLRS